jgi:hypothetical protein
MLIFGLNIFTLSPLKCRVKVEATIKITYRMGWMVVTHTSEKMRDEMLHTDGQEKPRKIRMKPVPETLCPP